MKKKLSALTLAMLPALSMAAPIETISYADDSIIVVYKPSSTMAERNAVHALINPGKGDINAGGSKKVKMLMNGRAAKFDIGAMGVKKAIATLKNHPAVLVAEPNYRWKADYVPNDEYLSELWAMQNDGQSGGVVDADIDATEAWDITTGSADIVIGIIDTGVNYNHPDLMNNAWVNPGEIAGNGVDDDNNGYIDDIYGIDVVNVDTDPMDDHGHGSHVSGTIGAEGDNGEGVVGVNHDVTIAGCKFLDAEGYGSTEGAIECIEYFVSLKNAGVNVRALNNSWGGGAYSEALEMAIADAGAADILFVAAAGNSGVNNDTSPHYPSSYELDSVFAVASTTRTDGDSGYSYGPTSVDIAAPGSAILSTVTGTGYDVYSGTSMATPHVAGAAALVWSINPALTAVEMKDLLMATGDDNAAMAAKTLSGKRLNVHEALIEADPTPGFNFNITPSSQEIIAGETATYTFEVSSISEWTGTVDLSVTDPLGTAYLSQTTAEPGDMVTLFVPTTEDTMWGEYVFEVTGTSGELEKSRSAGLSVLPTGLYDETYTNTTPVDIPDNDDAGITSTITVTEDAVVFGSSTSVDITHTWIGDLIVSLTSPEGTTVVLHNRDGGSEDDLVQTFESDDFNGELATGDWILSVSDNAGIDTGTLNSWSVTLSLLGGDDVSVPPEASFSYSTTMLTASFTDTSTDADDDIVSWSWSFGDGGMSEEQSPVYTFTEAGTYEVVLTVTDAEGYSDTATEMVTVAEPEGDLTAELRRATTIRDVRYVAVLAFSGTEDSTVDVYKNGEMVGTANVRRGGRGVYRDAGRLNGATGATYQFCDSVSCSEAINVSFE